MVQLKVIIMGTSPAETLRVEEALNQMGRLEVFRYIGLEQVASRVPDWDAWDLLIARHHPDRESQLLSLLAPVLRKACPPVFFLIDSYDPLLVTRLLNAGRSRVIPVNRLEELFGPNLSGVFQHGLPPAPPASEGQISGENGVPAEIRQLYESSQATLGSGFARLFHSSPVGISINRLSDRVCIDCNDGFARLLEWPREELIGRHALELGIPADIKKRFEPGPEEPGAVSRPVVQFERTIFTRSRQARQVQVYVDLIEWGGEECVLSLVQDITEKEQAKEKIKRLNDELERLVSIRTGALEAANRELAAEIARRKDLEDFSNQLSQVIWETPDVVSIYAADGQMQFLNKAGRALFGLGETDSVTHLDLFSTCTVDLRLWMREKIQPAVMRDGIWHGETSFQLPDGRVIPLSQVLLCKKDETGQVQYFASIARDVSGSKRIEQELRQSREHYRTLAEAAHDLIFMISKDGLMEYANGFACQTLGFEPGQVAGLPASQFFPKEFASNQLRLFSGVNHIERPIYTEGPFQLEEQEFWLGTWLVPIHNEQGALASVLGISRDITEQKKTDEALQRSLQNERKLNEMRSNFFSMTSHQFRTPLSTILLSAELLQKYGQRWDEQKRSEHLERIQEAAKRLNSMLEDILVIGRTEAGHYQYAPQEFDLVAFCEKSINEISTNEQNGHRFAFDHLADSLVVYQDPGIMQRVVDNLLTNAIKYSPKGSLVKVSLRIEEQDVLLEVSDQGIGIPERDMKHLFQPFQRGSNAIDYPGTGIGLTIIHQSVEMMNGSVSLNSQEGQGTTFTVRFPARFNGPGGFSN